MQNFINDRQHLVSHALDGVVATAGGRLQRFHPDSHAQVVLRADWQRDRVAIVSGGGSGHEPAHAGFVGRGMLTAAVCGDVFASPSVEAVLAAIVAVTGGAGCLLVVKNYTGDRLNFGLAAERAKACGLDVEVVVVDDDVALGDVAAARGLAGTLLVHKVAGHAAEQGATLAEVAAVAHRVAAATVTLGAARETAMMPTGERSARLADHEVEIGLGIHGEPGAETRAFEDADELVDEVTTRLAAAIQGTGRGLEGPFAAVLNDLGGLSGLEQAVVARAFARSELAASTELVVGPAPLMTSLGMAGFSISLLALEEGDADALRAPVETAAWPGVAALVDVAAHTVDASEPSGERPEPSEDPTTRAAVETIADALVAMRADLDRLDAVVGDGDTGTTFATAGEAIRRHLDRLPLADPALLARSLSDLAAEEVGGSSGVLAAILLSAAAEALADDASWAGALSRGVDAMTAHGAADVGDRTMIDALRPALDRLVAGDGIHAATTAARKGADATARMDRAGAGRSSYLTGSSLDGTPDPGAEGVARLFAALAASA